MNGSVRLVLILLVVAGAVFTAVKFTPHHDTGNPFTTLYMHVVPAALVPDPSHHHEEGEAPHHLFETDLPGFMALFDMNPHVEGNQLVLTNLQIFQLAAVLLCLVCFLGLPAQIRNGTVDKLGSFFVGWAMWIRDEMVYPNMAGRTGPSSCRSSCRSSSSWCS